MDYPTPIVSVAWLRDHLNDPQVQVIDCRFALMDPSLGIRQYQSGHIPSAVHLDLNQHLSRPVQRHGGRHPLPDIDALAQTLGEAGVQSPTDTHAPTFVVVYDDSRFAFAARLWWLLRYMGHEQVAVLDGGFQSWVQAGYPVSQDGSVSQAATFTPQLQPHWVIDIEGVKQRKTLPTVRLVDSRQGDRYRGEREPIDPVAGHIPGAINLFWQEVTDDHGYALPSEQQRQRWQTIVSSGAQTFGAALPNAQATGVQVPNSSQEIIVYCGSGVTACVNLLSLELAGLPPGILYAGSWSDWCSYL